MSVSKKRKRKIICNHQEYIWYIREDRYYDGAFFNDYVTPWALHIVSIDKKLILYVPVGVKKPYILGHIQVKLLPKKYFLPFDIPEIITPKFVDYFITWVNENLTKND